MPDPVLPQFHCPVCSSEHLEWSAERGDRARVEFCAACGMGVLADRPADTSQFYTDCYYRQRDGKEPGYANYEFTAEHAVLWTALLIEALAPAGGSVLDIGCASGLLLRRLQGAWRRFGIEVNAGAAAVAREAGIQIIGRDVLASGLPEAYARAFDVITAIATYEHVLDIKAAVAASLAMLDPGGVLIFEVPLISETRDNSDWFNGSYEHIFYPTIRGIDGLFAAFPGVSLYGFEADIAGFSSSYLGVATRDPARFAEAQRLLRAMTLEDPQDLSQDETVLNLAYTVVHNFRPTPARILRLPELLERHFTPHLGTRLMQLWHHDATRAAAADWHELQARNWREAAEALQRQTTPEQHYSTEHPMQIGAAPSSSPAAQAGWPNPLVKQASADAGDAGILALLPFLVEGALSIAVLRALRAQGADVAVGYCLADTGGYARDRMADFAAENRLIDLSALHPAYLQDRLQRELAERRTKLVLQIGAFNLYPALPYLKQQDPALRLVDILYNEVGHTVNHFLYEACFNGVIVESNHMARFVRDNSTKLDPHVRVVTSGIDLGAFSPQPRHLQGHLRIGYIGRLSPEKNPLGFITLFECLAERVPLLTASIVGDGPTAEEVRRRVASSPMARKLTYLGRVESVAESLQALDVLVVPSTLDGRPNVVMEANACGVPVIGAPVGGIPELIEDGVNGYVAAPSETDRIASWLLDWAQHPDHLAAIRASSRKMAEARFDRRRMIADYAAAFTHFLQS